MDLEVVDVRLIVETRGKVDEISRLQYPREV